jgi:hypothetical protein
VRSQIFSGPAGFAGFAGQRAGIGPSLLRVLTDLYVQKIRHTSEEERHFTELALRLLDEVDVATRAAVAAQLATYAEAPPAVVARLAADLPQIAAPIGDHPALRTPPPIPGDDTPDGAPSTGPSKDDARDSSRVSAPHDRVQAPTRAELADLFFSAEPSERRLILLALDIAAFAPAEPLPPALATTLCRAVERAALARNAAEVAKLLERGLAISPSLAVRLIRDVSGEPMTVAAKALGMDLDAFQRVILFLNPAVGLSVTRVYDLSELYEEMSTDAARRLVSIWQQAGRRAAPVHTPVYWDNQAHERRETAALSPRAVGGGDGRQKSGERSAG